MFYRRRSPVLLLIVTLTALFAMSGATSEANPPQVQSDTRSNSSSPIVATSRALPTGAILVEFVQDARLVAAVVADEGSVVKLQQTISMDGRSGGMAIGIIPPEPRSDDEALEMAAQYSDSGRTPASDLSAINQVAPPSCEDQIELCEAVRPWLEKLGRPLEGGSESSDGSEAVPMQTDDLLQELMLEAGGGGKIYKSGCATINDNIYWRGCYARHTVKDADPGYHYSGDRSQASGWGNFWWGLTKGRTDHRYGQYGEVIKWKPGASIEKGSCTQVTISASYSGTGISETFSVCPERVDPKVFDHRFYVDWSGHSHGATRESAAVDFVKAPTGHNAGFQYWVSAWWHWG